MADVWQIILLRHVALHWYQSQQIVLNLIFPPKFTDLADRIKTNWQKISNKIIVKNQVSYENNPQFDALIKIQPIPPDPDQYYFWHSTQPGNITHLASPRIDQFLEDGRKEIDPDKRKEIYLNFQKYLMDESPVIILFHPQTYTVKRLNPSQIRLKYYNLAINLLNKLKGFQSYLPF